MAEISNSELEVLKVLWAQHPLSANQIIERLNRHQPWHQKTVKTLLNRLVSKQAIGFEKVQRMYLYSPLLEQESYQIKQSESLIARIFGGRISPLVSGFAKRNNLQKEDIDELKALIKQWEQDHD
ncbi:BlaI/MecI/CopY family transcriptional regulator [uncultured Ferrimonas sp.]|uniref:BlaI/MecI/CopY family transcriptional regulator n=1 Tax=uncultured Ferrimonas sp. TaxID=432640 RepID=UPI0026084A48|nr:BlaI/MecI/CopY family transcriptional regulator [uncultured Ferrimonas sp.]